MSGLEPQVGSESQATPTTENAASTPETSTQVNSTEGSSSSAQKPNGADAIRQAAQALPDDGMSATKAKGPEGAATPQTGDPAAVVPPNGQQQSEVYQPNLKYKVKNQEKEFDKRLAQIIKTKDDEEFVRQLVTKAEGIEEIRGSRDEIAQKFQTLQGDVDGVLNLVEQGQFGKVLNILGVNTQDVGQVMQGLGFSKGDIIKYAYQLANLTPEQEMFNAKQREFEMNNRQLLNTVQQTQQQMMNMQVQSRTIELQNTMARPEYSQLVKAFDSAKGDGAFWDEVVKRGQTYFAVHKKDVPVQMLVDEVASLIKGFMPQQTQQPIQQPQAVNQFQTNQSSPQATVPVIPNVGGGSQASPAKKKIKSVSELRSFGNSLSD